MTHVGFWCDSIDNSCGDSRRVSPKSKGTKQQVFDSKSLLQIYFLVGQNPHVPCPKPGFVHVWKVKQRIWSGNVIWYNYTPWTLEKKQQISLYWKFWFMGRGGCCIAFYSLMSQGKTTKFWHITPLWRQGKLSTVHSVLKCNQNLCHAPVVMAREEHHGSSAIGVLVKKSIEKLFFKITSEFHWNSFGNAGIETIP